MKAKISGKNILKAVWIIYASLSIVIWLPQVDKLFSKDYDTVSAHIPLDDSWDITINNDSYSDVSLNDFSFPLVNKGDEIFMKRTLPADWDITAAAMRLHIRQSAVRMYIDDELIYEYGYDRMKLNKTVGSGFQFINFPDEYKGKTLTIHLYLTEDEVFTRLDSIRLYEWENAYRALMTENRVPMYLGWFLLVFGIIATLITIFAVTFSLKYIRILCISLFSICMGFWTLCYYNIILIFSIPLYSVSMLEYITLYLSPLPLTIYMSGDVKNLNSKGARIVYRIIFGIQILFVGVMVTLHTLDIVHLAAGLKMMQVLVVGCLAWFFLILILNFKKSRMADKLYLAGMLVIGAGITYDLADYVGSRYYGNEPLPVKGVSSIAVLIFIFIMVCSFYISVTEKLMKEKERNYLIKSAYTDELTNLHNRRYCMEYINKIKEGETIDYTVVCFDLNDLKVMNDTYGHVKGDVLIKSAADVIDETFGEYGVVARMGGDEFIAIVNTADTDEVAAMIEKFKENLGKKNQEMRDLHMTIACGYASGSEVEYDIEKTYQMADDRMYENKKEMKTKS